MPDKKLTDNEIIKALECCGAFDDGCTECPYNEIFAVNCINYLCKDALDLINRLQEDSSGLKKVQMQLDDLCKMHNIIKSEAYKECIEKVKEKSKKTEVVCSGALVTMSYAISNKNLDNLLKELVGEEKGDYTSSVTEVTPSPPNKGEG